MTSQNALSSFPESLLLTTCAIHSSHVELIINIWNWFHTCCSLFLEHPSLTSLSSEISYLFLKTQCGCSSGMIPLRGLWLTVLCSFLVMSPFLIIFKCTCFFIFLSVSSFRVGAMLLLI